jgi:tetratricopeptide (TPR) repeat protein
MDEDSFADLAKLCEKSIKLLNQKRPEEAFTILSRISMLKSSTSLSDSERIIILYTQAAYFDSFSHTEKVKECCKELFQLIPSTNDSFFYFSLGCLLFSKLASKTSNTQALKIAKKGFKYLKLMKDSEDSIKLLQEYKDFLDLIEKTSEIPSIQLKPKFLGKPSQKPLPSTKLIYENPSKSLVFPALAKPSSKVSSKLTKNTFLNESKLKVLNSIYFSMTSKVDSSETKQVRRTYFNKSVQPRRRLSEPAEVIQEVLKVLINKFKINLLKRSTGYFPPSSFFPETQEKSLKSKRKTRGFSSCLPPIPEIS